MLKKTLKLVLSLILYIKKCALKTLRIQCLFVDNL